MSEARLSAHRASAVRRTRWNIATPWSAIALAACVALGCLAAIPAQASDLVPGTVRLSIDRAKVVRIPREADTVVIGNPSIVNATLQDATTIVLTGRSAGETNLIVLDEAGDPIVDETLVVGGPSAATVSVYAPGSRLTYACVPDCNRTLTVGDENGATSTLSGQIRDKFSLSKE